MFAVVEDDFEEPLVVCWQNGPRFRFQQLRQIRYAVAVTDAFEITVGRAQVRGMRRNAAGTAPVGCFNRLESAAVRLQPPLGRLLDALRETPPSLYDVIAALDVFLYIGDLSGAGA